MLEPTRGEMHIDYTVASHPYQQVSGRYAMEDGGNDHTMAVYEVSGLQQDEIRVGRARRFSSWGLSRKRSVKRPRTQPTKVHKGKGTRGLQSLHAF